MSDEALNKESLLKMVIGLDNIAKTAPDYPLDKYYLIVCFNLLEIKETLLAEGVFDRIKSEYFRFDIKQDLKYAMEQGQEAISIQNKMSLIEHPGLRAKAIKDLKQAQSQAEFMLVVNDFPAMCEESDYISGDLRMVAYKNTLNGFEFTFDLNKDKPWEH